jgi:hypothetical protein
MVGRIPDVVGVILGGSVGRGEPWPLSDIDLIVVCSNRTPKHIGGIVSDHAYRLSEMWGTAGSYTAVDGAMGRAVELTGSLLESVSDASTSQRCDFVLWCCMLAQRASGPKEAQELAAPSPISARRGAPRCRST